MWFSRLSDFLYDTWANESAFRAVKMRRIDHDYTANSLNESVNSLLRDYIQYLQKTTNPMKFNVNIATKIKKSPSYFSF